MDRVRTKTYWVGKISVAGILRFLVQDSFAGIRVNYDRAGLRPAAAKLLAFLGKSMSKKIFFPVELTLDKRTTDGHALYYKVEEDLAACIDSFFIRHIPKESKRFKNMLKSYMSSTLKQSVIFVVKAAHEIDAKRAPSDVANVICLDGHPLNYLLAQFYRGRGFNISRPIISVKRAAFYLKPISYMAFFLLCRSTGSRVKTNISDIRPSIWAEYYPSPFHTFWMDKVRQEGFDVVNYLDRPDTPLTRKTIDDIEGRNLKWIDAHTPALIKLSRLSFAAVKNIFSELSLISFSRLAWLGVFRFEYTFFASIYESVFLYYKVKILLQHQEASWKQEAQAAAIERAGGIMVGYHWSVYTYASMATENFPQHVYFAWGRMMRELVGKKESERRSILPSGVWIVPGDVEAKRENVFGKGVNFVISVFDSGIDNLLQFPGALAAFYSKVLDIVKKNPSFGCIVKSRQPIQQAFSSLPGGKEILAKAEDLKRENRLSVFDFNEYPIAAAAHSHLSVGYGINSACTVAAVTGRRNAISWDCSGLKRHPFYKYPDQRIVFETLEGLEDAILKASAGDATVGDYARWRRDVNHFEDYNAANRIAGFLESYMKENIETGDPARSLELAVKRYKSDHKVGEDFYQDSGLWGNG